MPSFANLMNVLLGYGTSAERREGARYRKPTTTLSYGDHPLQALDLHLLPATDEPRPLLAFMHGGAWQFGDKTRRMQDAKVPFAHGEGWHFASINTRLVPAVGVAEMAQDLAAAVATLFERADEFGIDRHRIVLMGHSSGAHLAGLVATDPALLGAHGLAPDKLAGVIANDGAAYRAADRSTDSWLFDRRLIRPAFEGADLRKLSPVVHAMQVGEPGGAESVPPFLILHTADRQMRHQAVLLQEALEYSGSAVERHAFPQKGILAHMRLSRYFGRAGFGPTEVARVWLQTLCSPSSSEEGQ